MRAYLLIIAVLFPSYALGCSCYSRPLDILYDKADYVYIGRVMSATVTPNEVIESQLEAKEVLKGTPDQYTFKSAASFNAMCEAVVAVGETYMVFGNYNKIPILLSCSPTRPLMLVDEDELEKLRKMAANKAIK